MNKIIDYDYDQEELEILDYMENGNPKSIPNLKEEMEMLRLSARKKRQSNEIIKKIKMLKSTNYAIFKNNKINISPKVKKKLKLHDGDKFEIKEINGNLLLQKIKIKK